MYIIPAIDIIDGKVVRLKKGDYQTRQEYSNDPVGMAQRFEDAGLSRLHLIDLDGAKQQRVVNLGILEKIAVSTDLAIDFGGGVRSTEDATSVFDAGARQLTAGSVAVHNPQLLQEWLSVWGPERIILGVDIRDGQVAIGAWEEKSSITWMEFIKEKMEIGITQVISTDIKKDGMLQGPSFSLYQEMGKMFPGLKLIASGGVSSNEDLERLEQLKLYGAIVGKAYYEGKVSLQQLSYINNRSK